MIILGFDAFSWILDALQISIKVTTLTTINVNIKIFICIINIKIYEKFIIEYYLS